MDTGFCRTFQSEPIVFQMKGQTSTLELLLCSWRAISLPTCQKSLLRAMGYRDLDQLGFRPVRMLPKITLHTLWLTTESDITNSRPCPRTCRLPLLCCFHMKSANTEAQVARAGATLQPGAGEQYLFRVKFHWQSSWLRGFLFVGVPPFCVNSVLARVRPCHGHDHVFSFFPSSTASNIRVRVPAEDRRRTPGRATVTIDFRKIIVWSLLRDLPTSRCQCIPRGRLGLRVGKIGYHDRLRGRPDAASPQACPQIQSGPHRCKVTRWGNDAAAFKLQGPGPARPGSEPGCTG